MLQAYVVVREGLAKLPLAVQVLVSTLPFLSDQHLLCDPELAGAGAGPVELTLLHSLFLVQALIGRSPGPTITCVLHTPMLVRALCTAHAG